MCVAVVNAAVANQMVIVAVRSALETMLRPGTVMGTAQASLHRVQLRGGPVVLTDLGTVLLETLKTVLLETLKKEGSRSCVAVPLRVRGEVYGLLNLGSKSHEAFVDDDLPFFTALGAGIERRLFNLVARSQRVPLDKRWPARPQQLSNR